MIVESIVQGVEQSVRALQTRPMRLALGLGLVTVGAALGWSRLEIDPDVGALLPDGHPEVELFRATRLDEESSRRLFLLVAGEELEARLAELLPSLEASPYLAEVVGTRDQLGGELRERATAAPLAYLPEASLDRLEQRLSPDGLRRAAEEAREAVAGDPLLGREVVAGDPVGLRYLLGEAAEQGLPAVFDPSSPYLLLESGRQAFVEVTGREPAFDVEFSEALLADLEERCSGLELVAAGGYAIAREDSRRIRGDLRSSLQWSIPLLVVFFLLTSRGLLVPPLYVLPTALALFWTLGAAGPLLGPLTPLTVSAAGILCGLGVDFSIHFVGRFREERAGSDFDGALAATLRGTSRSLIGCWTTSCVAFLSVSLGSFGGLRDLGWLLAIGLSFALLSTWTFLPLLLRFSPRLPAAPPPPFAVRGARALVRRGWAGPACLLLALAAAAGWGLALTRGVVVDADPRHIRPTDSEVAAALDRFEECLGFSPEAVTLLLDGAQSPALLVTAAERLREEGRVAFSDAASLVAHSPERRARMAELRTATTDWVAHAEQAFARAGFRVESLRDAFADLSARLERDPPPEAAAQRRLSWAGREHWSASFAPPRRLATGAERRELREALQSAVPAPTRVMDPAGLGDALGPALAGELRSSVLVCAVLVGLLILASVGRWRPALVALAPVVCALGVVLGGLVLAGWPIHPGNFLALPLVIGLGVDDGLHMVHRHLEGGGDPLGTTGADVWRTSVATAIGFGSLVTAQSPAISSLGAITLAGALVCFLASVLLVPWLLRRSHA